MIRLYLLRHGETDYNLQKIVQGGGIDSDLNETGYAQGHKFFLRYRDIPFDGIYCSGLKRTRQTLKSFEDAGREIIPLQDLNEMGWGELEGKPFDAVSHAAFTEISDYWAAGELHRSFPGGETPLEVWQRSRKALQHIQDKHSSGNILVCTHGRTLRILLSGLSGYGLERMSWFPHDNTGLNVLRSPGPSWHFERINCLKHLSEAQ
jgi:phosphoserine phosphatase